MQFELEASNRTVLIVYNEESYSDIVEFCGCLQMDLAAPRSTEEAQEIERRGQLKFGYFTNFVRLRTDLSQFFNERSKNCNSFTEKSNGLTAYNCRS